MKSYQSYIRLTDVHDRDAGHYQCVVQNRFGTAFSRHATVNVYGVYVRWLFACRSHCDTVSTLCFIQKTVAPFQWNAWKYFWFSQTHLSFFFSAARDPHHFSSLSACSCRHVALSTDDSLPALFISFPSCTCQHAYMFAVFTFTAYLRRCRHRELPDYFTPPSNLPPCAADTSRGLPPMSSSIRRSLV